MKMRSKPTPYGSRKYYWQSDCNRQRNRVIGDGLIILERHLM